MSSRPLPLRALRYRAGQTVLLAVLVVGAIAACAVGPMYQRAVEQATVRSALSTAPVDQRGIRVDTLDPGQALSYFPPGRARSLFGPAVLSLETPLNFPGWRQGPLHVLTGTAVFRDGVCAHLRIVAGHCASGPTDLVMSVETARYLHFAVGHPLPTQTTGGSGATAVGTMTVAGLYQVPRPAEDYWFGRDYETPAGVRIISDGDGPDVVQADPVFVGEAAVTAFGRAYLAQTGGGQALYSVALDMPIRVQRVGADDVEPLRAFLRTVQARIAAGHPVGDPARGRLVTGLPALLDTAAAGHTAIIPTLAAQLALVVLVVLALVMAVGVDQRRPELALARLRGAGRGAAARFFVGENVLVVALAVLPGLGVAWLLCRLLCAVVLPGSVTPEWRWPVLAAAAAVAAVTVLIAVVLARRAATQPIQDLLRNVAPRRSPRAVGVLEAAVVVAALGGVLAVLTGGRRSALALITPGLIALLAGLLVSRLVLVAARARGGRALWRGRLATAIAALHVARSPDFRRVLTIVCIAAALTVSAVTQWSVAARARATRAAVEVGAARVLTVQPPTGAALLAAARQADPTGRSVAPVIVQTPVGGQTPLVAVDSSFRSVADWGTAADRPGTLGALVPAHRPKPIAVRGSTVRLELAGVAVARVAAGERPRPVQLRLYFRLSDGTVTTATFALRTTAAAQTVSAALGGCAGGCELSRIELQRASGDFVEANVSVAVRRVSVGGVEATLGAAGDWANVNADQAASGVADDIAFVPGDGSTLTLRSDSHGSSATLQHLDVPVALPCLTAGTPNVGRIGRNRLSVHGIDGTITACAPSGTVPFVPGVGSNAIVVDLGLAIAAGTAALSGTTALLYLADPGTDVRAALAAHGIRLLRERTARQARARYDDAPPAWAIQLALIAACAAAVVAALMIVIVAFTSRRGRSRDLAALRLVGVPARTVRRAVTAEQLVAVLVGTAAGAAVGVLGARLALPSVPLFVTASSFAPVDLATRWPPVAAATAAVFALLLLAAATAGWVLARRLTPDRVEDGG